MRIDVRHREDVIVVDLKGRLVAGFGDEVLREVVNELLAESWKKIVLNLTEVERIDSAGIGELVASSRLADRFGSSLKLLHVRGQVREILELSQILPIFDVFEDEDEAVGSF